MQRLRFPLVLFAVLALTATAAAADRDAAMKQLAGAWMVVTTVYPHPATDNELVVFPELISFTSDGTVHGSSALMSFSVDVDGAEVPVLATDGHANCKKIGRKRFATTQIRFFSSMLDGEFLGYLRITTDFRLQGRRLGTGHFLAEVLQPDFTPYLDDGVPIALEGEFAMERMAVERLR